MGRATADGPPASLGNRMVPHPRRRRNWLLAVIVTALVAGFLVGLTRAGTTPERPLAPDVAPNRGILAGPGDGKWATTHGAIRT